MDGGRNDGRSDIRESLRDHFTGHRHCQSLRYDVSAKICQLSVGLEMERSRWEVPVYSRRIDNLNGILTYNAKLLIDIEEIYKRLIETYEWSVWAQVQTSGVSLSIKYD